MRKAGDKSVCSFPLATQNGFGESATTEWHNVVLWEKQADTAGRFLKKGSKIYVEGRIQTRQYEKDGATKYMTEVVGQMFQMLDAKPKDEPAPDTSFGFEADIPF